ncbi:MAG TPA: complex I subunit 1 family protein [Holophagaceae bacterium]|nr:complex I subunit 1 family protein [Holophagaceae bacterium]
MPTLTLTQTVVMAMIQIIAVIAVIMLVVPLLTFAERKVIAYVQVRLGATRTAGGLWGASGGRHNARTLTGFLNMAMWALGRIPVFSILRGIPVFAADGLKLVTKEDIIPAKADKLVFILAPIIAMVPAFVVFAAICFYPGALFYFPKSLPIIGGLAFNGFITDVNVGLLYILSVASVGVYGIVLGGWASNSKYPLLGGLRSAAQIISYEVPLTLSLLVPVLLAGSLNVRELCTLMAGVPLTDAHGTVIKAALSPMICFPLFMGFFLYTVCGFAETNRVPFDLAEAETELVSGFHTEYTGMKFGWFFLAEYANMMVVSSIAAGFFLGGHYLLPFGLQAFVPVSWGWLAQPHLIFFAGKVGFLLFVFLWVRATLPRYRFDQLMEVGWKWLIPVTLANLVLATLIRFAF